MLAEDFVTSTVPRSFESDPSVLTDISSFWQVIIRPMVLSPEREPQVAIALRSPRSVNDALPVPAVTTRFVLSLPKLFAKFTPK